jgi:hypothetical protein
MSDIWADPPPVHYDNEERFGTALEMIAEIRRLRTAITAAIDDIDHHDESGAYSTLKNALKS